MMDENRPGTPSSSDDDLEACWQCGAMAWCAEVFVPCTGTVVRLCQACAAATSTECVPGARAPSADEEQSRMNR